jgi:hypothetical protein
VGGNALLKLSRSQVIEIIDPHMERLFNIGAIPLERWKSDEYPNRALHIPRTRANVLYDLMVIQARIEFRGIRGAVMIDTRDGVTLLEIDQKILLRFKKLDDDSLPSNYPTVRARDYDMGEDLPGIPSSPQRLTLGYRLNQLQTEIKDVLISNSMGGRLLYDIILEEPKGGITIVPEPSSNPNSAPKRRRIIIRPSEEQTEL